MLDLLKRPLVGYALSALLLTGILTSMVYARVQHLRHGREIIMSIRPVDPRDLFKGDYVRLAFNVARPPGNIAPPNKAMWRGDKQIGTAMYVLLEKTAIEGDWKVVSETAKPPVAAANQVVLQADNTYDLRFGIERYYVPEGTGPKLEDQARTGKLAAIVAVDAKGRAAIKGLMLDGKVIHREPLL
jgi:uncharacterized membrane-anchored protein